MTQGGLPMPSRRELFALAGIGLSAWGRLYAFGADFWNKKAPSEWSSEEIDRILTKSPWAKEVTAQYAQGERTSGSKYPDDSGGYPSGGSTYPGGGTGTPRVGIGGIGGIPGIGGSYPGSGRTTRTPRSGGTSRDSSYRGTVRWESAQPVLDATKTMLPEAFANHYVIAVSGIPLVEEGGRRSRTVDDSDERSAQMEQGTMDRLKQFTTLQPKDRDLAQPGLVQRQVGSGTVLLFGFAKETLQLNADDKEVRFATRLGDLTAKAKFDLKDMVYHGKLAL